MNINIMVNFVQYVAYYLANTTLPSDTNQFEYKVPKSIIEYLAATYAAYTLTFGKTENDPGAVFRNLSKAERSQKVQEVVDEWERKHPRGSLDTYVSYTSLDALTFSRIEIIDVGPDYKSSKKARFVQHVSGTSSRAPIEDTREDGFNVVRDWFAEEDRIVGDKLCVFSLNQLGGTTTWKVVLGKNGEKALELETLESESESDKED